MIDKKWIDACVRDVAEAFGIGLGTLKYVQASRNVVYRGEIGERPVALRMPRGRYWSQAEIEGEFEFVTFLSEESELTVCRPMVSLEGGYTVGFNGPGGEMLHASCFEWIGGRLIEGEDACPELYDAMGERIAQFHEASERFRKKAGAGRRRDWVDSPLLDVATVDSKKYPDAILMGEQLKRLIGRLDCIEKTDSNFGMIHGDFHARNLHLLEGGEMGFFDFDNCERGYFMGDLANAIYGNLFCPLTRYWRGRGKFEAFQKIVIKGLLRGYRRRRPISNGETAQIWDYILVRQIVYYFQYLRDPLFEERGADFKKAVHGLLDLVKEGKTEMVSEAKGWVENGDL